MDIEKTSLDGVVIFTPRRFSDDRGWFCETWNEARLCDGGFAPGFVQDNHSFSAVSGTLRGLHYQKPPHAQAKLVRCSRGSIFDVAVDARRASPTYGEWVGVTLTPENGRQLLVPEGFLHGFMTLVPDTEVQYKCTDFYAPDCDGAVRWDSVGIAWPSTGEGPVLSSKDEAAELFGTWTSPF